MKLLPFRSKFLTFFILVFCDLMLLLIFKSKSTAWVNRSRKSILSKYRSLTTKGSSHLLPVRDLLLLHHQNKLLDFTSKLPFSFGRTTEKTIWVTKQYLLSELKLLLQRQWQGLLNHWKSMTKQSKNHTQEGMKLDFLQYQERVWVILCYERVLSTPHHTISKAVHIRKSN